MAGRVDDAIADYTSALELFPGSVLALYSRGLLLLDQKDDPQAALGDFSLLVSIDPNDKTYQLDLARAYQGIGNTDAAFAATSKALELDPEYVQAYRIRGDLYSIQGHVTEAIADYSKAIEINPDYDLAFKLRGELYRKLERNEAAVADFTRAIEIDPEYGEAILSRAYALMSLGQYESAVEELTRALELYPDHSWAIFARGRSYRHLQRYDLAILDLAKAGAAGEIYASLFLYLTEWPQDEGLARDHLEEAASSSGSQDWPGPILDYLLGATSRDALLATASNPGEKCEAHFYVASDLLVRKETEAAIDLLRKAVSICPHDYIEYEEARAELAALTSP
jgi:tetratricopeptide (TPR) repeat protein